MTNNVIERPKTKMARRDSLCVSRNAAKFEGLRL
jgi:hypothetical protein